MPSSPARDRPPRAAPRRDSVTVEIIPGDRLEEVRVEWAALWAGCSTATPFQAPAWLLPWARHYAPHVGRAAALRAEGRMVALLPGFVWRGALLLAGTGPSDYGDGLFRPGFEAAAGALVAALAARTDEPFDRIDLQQIPRESPLLRAPCPAGWEDRREDGTACPVAPLRGEHGMEPVSPRWRANWRYAMRRIAREGGSLDTVSGEDIRDGIAALERLHGLRWRERGETGVLADALVRRHLREAVPELAAAGLLRLHRLRFGTATVAILLTLAGHGRVYYYLSGFDPDYSALSPGTALVGAAMARAAREGATEFHFLRGREPYKYRWGAEDRPTFRRVLIPARGGPAS